MVIKHPKSNQDIIDDLEFYCLNLGDNPNPEKFELAYSTVELDPESGKVFFLSVFEIPIETQIELKLADDPNDMYKSDPQYFLDLLEEEKQAKEKARLLKIKLDKLVIEHNKRIGKGI